MRECKLRLIGTDGEDIKGYNEEGEVLFKSPNMFIGYLGDEVATRDAFTADGWLRTGDLGVIKVGPNGWDHLFIQGRIKDMIKVKVGRAVPIYKT
jgi:long-subunit acyl-CoA synthetase (AMP-forming)